MELKGLKQVELAEKSGISESFISNLLAGKRHDITLTTAVKFANALNINAGEFVNNITKDN